MTPRRASWWTPYCGGPYRFRGRDIVNGIDCWGLYVLVMRLEFGRHVDDFGDLYASHGEARDAIAGQIDGFRETTWEEGAGVLLNVGARPLHIGIATPTRGVILHAHESTGVDTVDVFKALRWKGKYAGCYVPR